MTRMICPFLTSKVLPLLLLTMVSLRIFMLPPSEITAKLSIELSECKNYRHFPPQIDSE